MPRPLPAVSYALCLVLLGTGCGNKGDTDVPTVPSTTDAPTEETGDTATEPLRLPALVGFSADFGFDLATGKTTTVTGAGQSFPPVFRVLMATEAWDQRNLNSPEVCTVMYDIGGQSSADWIEEDHPGRFWFGLEVGSAGSHDCEAFDLSGVPGEDPVAYWAQFDWGVAVGGEMSNVLEQELRGGWGVTTDQLDEYVPGFLRSDLLTPDNAELVAGQAFKVDGSMELELDEQLPVALTRDEIEAEVPMATGWYTLTHLALFSAPF